MYFKKLWFFGKDIITTEVSDAIIDIRDKKRGYVISSEEDKMINEIIEILRKKELKENSDKLEDKFKEDENISYYIKENNVNSNKIYNDILELTKE